MDLQIIHYPYARITKKKDSRIKIINKCNGGLVSARKAGCKVASGEYILMVDGDDWLETTMIEKMVQPLKKNREIDIVICNFSYDYKEKSIVNNIRLTPGIYDKQRMKEIVYPQLIYPRIVESSVCCKLIKRTILHKNIFMIDNRIQIGEDTAITVATLLDANNFIFLGADPLYHYRQNSASMTKTYKEKYFEKTLILVENLRTISKVKHVNTLDLQINQLLVTFAFLAIDNEYISKYHIPRKRKEIVGEIVKNEDLQKALRDMNLKTLNFKNIFFYFLIKGRMVNVLCLMNLILRRIKPK